MKKSSRNYPSRTLTEHSPLASFHSFVFGKRRTREYRGRQDLVAETLTVVEIAARFIVARHRKKLQVLNLPDERTNRMSESEDVCAKLPCATGPLAGCLSYHTRFVRVKLQLV